MARAQATDFLHSMRFHVTATLAGDNAILTNSPLQNTLSPSAGFMSCSTPEATTESVEYREGTYNYPRKFPGNTTVSDVTLQKGVARGDGTFWRWMLTVIEGAGEYRANVDIFHYDRRVLNNTTQSGDKSQDTFYNATLSASTTAAARVYHLYEAFPIRHKVAADLDASTSDISIMELDLAYEHFDITENTPSSASGTSTSLALT